MRLLAALAIFSASALPAAAQIVLPGAAGVEARLIPGWREADGDHVAAVEIRMPGGWHTYWRVPGEAGIAPTFDWSASGNLAGATVAWPAPRVFENGGGYSIGYSDRLVLPVRLEPARPGDPIDARLALSFGVCREICSIERANLSATLAPDGPAVGAETIGAALAELPLSPREAGLVSARCGLGTAGAEPIVTAELDFAAPQRADAVMVIEAADRPDVWVGWARTRTVGASIHAEAPLAVQAGGSAALDRRDLRVTVIYDDGAVDVPGCSAD